MEPPSRLARRERSARDDHACVQPWRADSPEKWGSFRQLEPIDFFPTYYPALVPPTEPQPPTSGGQADPCGALTASEQTELIAEAKDAKHDQAPAPTLNKLASYALTKH